MDWLKLFLAPRFCTRLNGNVCGGVFSPNSLVVPLYLQQYPTDKTHSISNYIPEHATATGSLTILSLFLAYDVI